MVALRKGLTLSGTSLDEDAGPRRCFTYVGEAMHELAPFCDVFGGLAGKEAGVRILQIDNLGQVLCRSYATEVWDVSRRYKNN